VLDAFVSAMAHILKEAEEEPEHVKSAPHTMPVRRLDDVRAAKQLDLTWKPTPTPPAQVTAPPLPG
jgi:glycine dehydrogenase subunit 2